MFFINVSSIVTQIAVTKIGLICLYKPKNYCVKIFFELLFATCVAHDIPCTLEKVINHGYLTNKESRICGIITIFERIVLSLHSVYGHQTWQGGD